MYCTLGGEELALDLVWLTDFAHFVLFLFAVLRSFIVQCMNTFITQSTHYREIKRLRRQKRKLKERAATKGGEYRETSELTRQEDLFRLGHIKSRGQLEEVERGEMEIPENDKGEEESESKSEDEEMEGVISCLDTR